MKIIVIFKLKWPIIPVPRPYKGNIEPDWLRRPIKPKVTQIQLKNDVIKAENIKEEKVISVDNLQVESQILPNTNSEKKVEENFINKVVITEIPVLEVTKIEPKINKVIENSVTNLENNEIKPIADLSFLDANQTVVKDMILEQKCGNGGRT